MATRGGVGFCPACSKQLIPRCGRINIHHWAHQRHTDCDSWSEPDTRWHLEWKLLVRPESSEVQIGTHRADIVGNNGVVIELQHGSISVDDIEERERYYAAHAGMVWVINAEEFRDNVNLRNKGEYFSFRWKRPRKSHGYITEPLFWDFCDGRMFQVKKIHENLPCGGWGYPVTRDDFIYKYLNQVVR